MENKRNWSERLDDWVWLKTSSKKPDSKQSSFAQMIIPWVATGMMITVVDMIIVGGIHDDLPMWIWGVFAGAVLFAIICVSRSLWQQAEKHGHIDAIYQCYLKRWQATKERLDKQKVR